MVDTGTDEPGMDLNSPAVKRAIAAFGELSFVEKLEVAPILAQMLRDHHETNRLLELQFTETPPLETEGS